MYQAVVGFPLDLPCHLEMQENDVVNLAWKCVARPSIASVSHTETMITTEASNVERLLYMQIIGE